MRTFIADAYAWIAYFEKRQEYAELIDCNNIKTPASVLSEVLRVMKRKKVARHLQEQLVSFIRDRGIVLELGAENAVSAAILSEELGLYLLDAMAYSYASEEEPLLTGDNHFRDRPNVHFVK